MPPRSRRHAQAAAVGAAAVALTLYMAWPVLRAPAQRLFGSELVGRFHDPFTAIRIFASPGASFGIYTQPLTDWVGALFAMAFDAVTAYNVVVLLTYPLTALAAFGLARSLGVHAGGAAVGALAFAFAPAHLAHSAYHPHIAQMQWIPLYLWAVWNACRRPSWARWSLAVAALVAMGLANFYFGWLGAVLLPVAALAAPQPARRRRRTAIGLAVAAALFACAVLTPLAASQRRSHGFPYEDAVRYAARPEAYLVPAADHALLGGLAREHWSRRAPGDAMLEQQQSVSWALLVLSLVAVVAYRHDRDDPALRYMPALVLTGVAAVLFSLPPELSLGERTLWLPSRLLYATAPMFRALARFGFFVQLTVCVGAAIGFDRLWQRRGRWTRILACGLVLVAAFEYLPAPPWRWRPLLPTEAHAALAASGFRGGVLDCLTPPHATPSVSRYLATRLLASDPDRLDCAEPELAGKLAALGVGRVIRDADATGLAGLALLNRYGDSSSWSVVADPAALYVSRLEGFSWRETSGGLSYRWLGGGGTLTVVARDPAPQTVVWHVQLHAFPGERELTVRLDGDEVAHRIVPIEPTWFAIGPMTLRRGTHALELLPHGPPAVPDELFGTGDRRPLTIALGAWRWSTE